MEIRLLEQDKENRKLSFVMKGSNTIFANLLRRYIVEKVPTMAMEDIEFKENTCLLYDEILAHRLGLVPLTTDLKSYNMISKCKCDGKGCNRCTLKLTLKADKPGYVYASSIKSRDPKVKPVYAHMPVAKLLKDQKIEFVATAVLGQGCDHTKFSPGSAYYKLKPSVEVLKNCENSEEVVKNCPLDIFELKNNKLTINKDNLMKCHICNACVDICKPNDCIKITNGPDIIFYIESWGQLNCKEIAVTAMDMFKQDLDEFESLIKK